MSPRRPLIVALVALALALPAGGVRAKDEPIPSAREVIERAFENFYDFDLKQKVEFVVRQSGSVSLQFRTHMMRKFIGGHANDLFYIVEGDRRKWKVLRIESEARRYEAFVYLPEYGRPRRYPMGQKGDKFLGLELNLEDLEIQRADSYEVVGRSFTSIEGEPSYVVALQPLYDSGYDRVDFFVARSDYAILQVRYYRRGALEPYKYAHAKREWMERYDDHVLPSRMDFIDHDLGTETTVHFIDRSVDPDLPQSRFSTLSLEKRHHATEFRAPEGDGDAP
ncbi:MAG: outer membrane lipoprotein-sorting protein [Myxococcota bacterium]